MTTWTRAPYHVCWHCGGALGLLSLCPHERTDGPCLRSMCPGCETYSDEEGRCPSLRSGDHDHRQSVEERERDRLGG